MAEHIKNLLSKLIGRPNTAISVGGLGAIAEFDGAPKKVSFDSRNELQICNSKGAFRVKIDGSESLLAYETLSQTPKSWQWGMAVLADRDPYFANLKNGLHEIGPDTDAISENDKDALLFSLGTGLSNSNFTIRTKDPTLLRILRSNEGMCITEGNNPVLDAIIDFSPHRVVYSTIARIEVYQEISRHETPMGPHTHLLPSLLKARRTHVAGIPIPASQSPQLTLHPENPMFDQYGHSRPFTKSVSDSFSPLVEAHCAEEFRIEKKRLKVAFKKKEKAINYVLPSTRLGRLAYKVTLRQLSHTCEDKAYLDTWLKT